MSDDDQDTTVRVAVRIRPQISRELIDMCRICTQVTPGEPQVVLGVDKAFTFDYVYDTNSKQSEIYETCVHNLVEGSLKGYNATILAYGQTGSGKTYTMGTGFERDIIEDLVGIIPRAVRHLFEGIERSQLNDATQFSVGVQFMELYNEDINDLLDPFSKGKTFKIHEDSSGGISIHGATIKSITGPQDALRCLQQGALARTTASTNMNEQSSRSHAVFTILVRRQRVMSVEETDAPDGDLETLTSKFHFVDLAGSERLKRTGATGERAREGISINCGLLALGNVISALGDKSKKVSHIPYRDSKLTRLLQDSLGGNSQTVMIACVSPSDRDFMETLNTLKYANRARNIKNKVQINQDQSSRTIASLRREIAALQLELLEYKQGKRMADPAGNSNISDTFLENEMLMADNKRLHQRLKAMQETVNCLTDKNAGLLAQKQISSWGGVDQPEDAMTQVVAGYLSEIEKLKARLIESEQMYQQLKKQAMNPVMKTSTMSFITEEPKSVIELAKRELEKEREILMSRSLPGLIEDGTSVIPTESAESDSDSDSEDKAEELQAEIADIQSDIEIKSKLIEQLELSQQRMLVMKQHYEDKLTVLNNKITNTQKERDQVLANMGGSIHSGSDSVKKVRDEYEKKISGMQKELRKLQSAQKEHLRQQRELQAQEAQMRSLRSELSDLKSMKIRLMKEMQKESNRHKEEENRKVREIAQLRKEARKQSSLIKSLQAQGAVKDQVLRRKTEEVSALRKSQRGKLSPKAAGRVSPSSIASGTPSIYNARHTKLKWDKLQRTIYRAACNKQAVMELARELERLIEERESLGRDLASVKRRKRINETPELISEEDTINANLNYIQENISQIQSSIMELEEGKESVNEQAMLQNAIDSVRSVDEAKFLLERLCNTSIAQVCDNGLTQIRLKEREALLNEVQQDSNIQQQLLAHVLQNSTNTSMGTSGAGEGLIEMDNISLLMSSSTGTLKDNGFGSFLSDSVTGRLPGDRSNRSSRSPSPNPSETESVRAAKQRKRQALPQELLFGDSVNNEDYDKRPAISQSDASKFLPLSRVPSAPGSLKGMSSIPLIRQNTFTSPSPLLGRKNYETSPAVTPGSPRTPRRSLQKKTPPGIEDTEVMQSPPVYRRAFSREDSNVDVFSRLGAGTVDPVPGGTIREIVGKSKTYSPFYCTHVVEGHSSSVLDIKVLFDQTLLTASADRTVKLWDLRKGIVYGCLSLHPGPVVAVEYSTEHSLLFSASGSFIRAWDLRESTTKPVKTLCSSGNTMSGTANISALQPGESPITAMIIGSTGNLYTAASSDRVRIWDLRKFSCTGKVQGGHQAAVMCLESWRSSSGMDLLATGSKDHYIKVFEIPVTGGLIYPTLNLLPPHYDGIQVLLATDKANDGQTMELFSGSRDTCIKRWDLDSGDLKLSINNAHKGWISGMAMFRDMLLTTCRGGVMRLWDARTCDALAEVKTSNPISGLVANDSRFFTASSSGSVQIWKLPENVDSLMSSVKSNSNSNNNYNYKR